MDWSIPEDVTTFLAELDDFIDTRIKPIEEANPEYFDHRREFARTDVERGGVPTRRWREIMSEARRLADGAGFYRYPLPKALGGQDATNVAMALVREHLAHRGPGLHAELSHEASVVANLPLALVLHEYGTDEQKEQYLERLVSGDLEMAFGLTEPDHGSDATWLETRAVRDGDDWVITGAKRWNSVVDVAEVDLVFARTSGEDGKAEGISAFLVPTDAPGFEVPFYWWTFNMPTDHAEVRLDGVRVPAAAMVGEEGRGLDCAQLFVHENRIRQAASSLGAAQFCIDRSVAYTEERRLFGTALRDYQGVQWQLVELQTEAELVRNTILKVAWEMDVHGRTGVSDKVSMVNVRGNRLACDAADRAMQVHGGVGYSRHHPFEHIYRHHRRYRITEGSDELQYRRIAAGMWDFRSGR
ncbi:alkylation response protein AidB-like acyl-CoA dehydrogenase [Nocardioides sp. J9]|uniref:acyl-CoA dehydrogenase family protein n=1 Tax=unclassified Nocardioides TaxID=2615069 RepID=UPI00048BDC69|nr:MULTISPECIES: acyl-CoA dehydrogenase family protein [unclassified Nocardioides]TWH00918.1 alkylation response protein AidB-like acyl-CoA dehydrogenase [Nocardioides sp. J9]